MIRKSIVTFAVAVGSAAICIAFLFGRPSGIGISLGILAASFNLWAMWLMIGAFGRMMNEKMEDDSVEAKRARIASALIVLAFFSKLPIFLALSMLTRHLGDGALTCFLVGIGLVYSALVGWALAPSYGPP